MFVNGAGWNEQLLLRTFHRCILPGFSSFGSMGSEMIFRNQPTRNKNCLWQQCLLTDINKMSNLNRRPSIKASCLVSAHFAKLFQRRIFFSEIDQPETRITYQGSTLRLALPSYFCKMRVKILYWLPDRELIYPENFHSLIDHIFQFNFRLWLFGLLNCTIDSDIKSFKSHTFIACKWPWWEKKKKKKHSYKINRLNQPIMKLACAIYQLKIMMKVLKLQA